MNTKLSYTNSNTNTNSTNKLLHSPKDILKDFWDKKIWEVDLKYITNQTILNIFKQYLKLKNDYSNNNTHINFDSDFHVNISNNKKEIKKLIHKFKKDNLNFLKIHADCIYEYHQIINQIFMNKNLKWDKEYFEINNIDNIQIQLVTKDIITHYKHFSKYINPIEPISTNITNIDDKLKYNLDTFGDGFIGHINKRLADSTCPFVIIDVENILKSYKIQYFLKSILSPEEYTEYFETWTNGYFQIDPDLELSNTNTLTNISLSQYSTKTKYIEPFTSLNLNINIKIKLLKIIIEHLLQNYNTINIITTNKSESIKNNENFVLTEKDYFIPIKYNKHDIREQDDHLILFLYTMMKKKDINVILLSNDKFKWYSEPDNSYYPDYPSNFKFLYDFDTWTKKLIIGNAYTPDIYKFDSKCFLFPFINFPIISEDYIGWVNNSNNNLDDKWESYNKIKSKFYLKSVDTQFKSLYFYLLKLSVGYNVDSDLDLKFINWIMDYLVELKKAFTKIFDFLNSNTKKEIFKISLENKNKFFSNEQIDNFLFSITKYKTMIELFQIIKVIGIKIYPNDKKFILFIISIFSSLIEIYDGINDNLYKIRKLSNSNSNLNTLFTELNHTFIFIRKQGYFKKNIYLD